MAKLANVSTFGLLVAALASSCQPTGGDPAPSGIDAVLTLRVESEHFVFHYAPDDGVDVARTEAFFGWISQKLSLNLEKKIQYFKFNNVSVKQQLTGHPGNAYAEPWFFGVYTIWPWDNHEITHVLTDQGAYPPDLFNEGMAVANQADPLTGSYTPTWNMVPLHQCARDLLADGRIPAFSDILETTTFRTLDPNITYPAAGSFMEHLIERYGAPMALQLFPGTSWNDAGDVTSRRFEQVFGLSLAAAEQDWRDFLQQGSP